MQKPLVIDMEREGDATYIWRPATAPSPLSSHLHPILNPVQESLVISDTDMEGEGDATYIWGTNLSVSVIQNRFNVFVREFREEGEAEPKYLRLLEEVGCLWRVGRVCDAARWTVSRELGLQRGGRGGAQVLAPAGGGGLPLRGSVCAGVKPC